VGGETTALLRPGAYDFINPTPATPLIEVRDRMATHSIVWSREKETNMYSNIMIPVDLRHTGQMEKVLSVAAGIAKMYGAKAHIVGVG